MKIEITKRDHIWNYLAIFLSLTSNFIMLPFILHYLDSDMVGMWYIFQSLGYIAQLMDFGFSVSFARNIAYCWCGAHKLDKSGSGESEAQMSSGSIDFRMMKTILDTCRKIYFFLALIAAVLLSTAGSGYIWCLAQNQGTDVLICMGGWIVYVAAIWMNLYYGYFAAFLRGVGRVAEANQFSIISKLAQIAVCVILLMLGWGLLGVSIAYCLYGIIFRISAKRAFFSYQNIGQKLAEIRERVTSKERKEMFSTIWYNAWRDGLVSLSIYLSTQASTIVTSAFMDLTSIGSYSLGMQIAGAIAQIASAAYNAYQPTLQSAYINSDRHKTKSCMSAIVVTYVVLFVLGYAFSATIGLTILRLLKPENIVGVWVFTGLCVYQFLLQLRNCYASYFSCTNRLIYMRSFLVSAIMGILLSIVLLYVWDGNVWGVVVAQTVSQLYNIVKWPVLAHREMKLRISEMPRLSMREVLSIMNK